MIKIRNIQKRFNNIKVLDGIDLDIQQGDVVAVIGPSGTGKSTFLRCIDKLETPESGSIEIDGLDIDLSRRNSREAVELRKHMGMVFQGFNLFSRKTVLENVMEGLVVVKKMSKAKAREIALSHIERVGLSDHLGHYPSQLSGGQQQRVAIARALAMDPTLLLLDEPTSALDPTNVREVLETIKEAADAGRTMLLVSHEMAFVQNVATKVIFLDGGKILESGSPKDVFFSPKSNRVREFMERINLSFGPDYSI